MNLVTSNNSCIHCGSDCGKTPVIWNNEKFCCNGCSQVYQILHDRHLTNYYSLERTPGIKVEEPNYLSKYAFLDNEAIQKKIFEFWEEDIAKVTFYIPTIHCISCIWLLEHLTRLHNGILFSRVDFTAKKISISFNTKLISLRQLVELLVSIHYIPDTSLQSFEKKEENADRTLLYKIGVAGFVFGNVMLYSLPEYLNGQPLGESLGIFLYFMSYFLLLPLLFYSANDYLISAFQNLRKGVVNINLPIAIGILTLFSVTTYEVFTKQGPGYADSLAGFLFFLLLGRWYQSKTYQALAFDRDYKSYFPVAVTKWSKDGETSILLEEVKEGDHLLIRSKELIPADAVIVSGTALIDYSFVTGESTIIRKNGNEFVYAGGRQTSGAIIVKVLKPVEQSHLTQLWNQVESKNSTHKSITTIIDRISVKFTVIVMIIAFAGFLYWFLKGDFKTAILVFTSVLIVSCPCALSMSLPFTLGSAMRILGNKGLYLKNITVIEKLTLIDTIVFDKTGTITKPNIKTVRFIGENLSDQQLQSLFSLTNQSTHPLSNAITKHFSYIQPILTEGFVEISGRGIYGKVNNQEYKIGSFEFVTNSKGTFVQPAPVVYLSIDNLLKGHFLVESFYRDGFPELLTSLKKQYSLYLLSGDHNADQEKLEHYFDADKLHFNQHAQDKMDFIRKLQSNGKTVLMTGDGLNDAGAFMQSNVALSIADDIYHFSPAGDAIVEASKIGQLQQFTGFAKNAMAIVKISLGISFLYNVAGLSFALSGNLSPVVAAILMPVSSVTVVAFATLATSFVGKRMLKN